MKFKDLFKKRNKKNEEKEDVKPQGPEEKEDELCADGGRRFTFLVTETTKIEPNGISVKGNIHGKLKKDDAAYIISPNGNITLSKIDLIETDDNKNADEAKDEPITLIFLDFKSAEQVAKYSVITSIRPQAVIDVDKAVENAQLLGLTMEYGSLCSDPNYYSLLVYVICHAHFIAPIYIDNAPQQNGDGTATFNKDSKIGFINITDQKDASKSFQPIFTDWDALKLWKGVFDEEHPAKTMVLRFPDVEAIAKNSQGAVINPYGPVPILLLNDFINRITRSEGYQNEFVKNKPTAKEVTLEKDTKIMVGVPKENSEVKMIREELISASKRIKLINKIYMLLKISEDGEKSYLLVVDCPEKNGREVYNTLAGAVQSYLVNVKYVEMMTLKQYGNGIDQRSLVYDRAEFWKN